MLRITCKQCACAKCTNKPCEYYCNEKVEDCDLGIFVCDYFKNEREEKSC